MRFLLSINCDGAAFHRNDATADPAPEVWRILRRVAERLESGEDEPITLLDLNGNTVGVARFDTDADGRAFVVDVHVPADADEQFIDGLVEEVASEFRGELREWRGFRDEWEDGV